jgi:hypothetical protein
MGSDGQGAAPRGAAELRAAVLALKAPQAPSEPRRPRPRSTAAPRPAVPGRRPAGRDCRGAATRLRSVETSALLPGTTLALVVSPQPRRLPQDIARSCEQLVAARSTVVVLGPDLPRAGHRPQPAADDPAAQRRLAERRVGDGGLRTPPAGGLPRPRREGTDVWDWLVTRDAVAVHRAGTALLERVPFLRLRVPALAG